jgi:hypothetical protein
LELRALPYERQKELDITYKGKVIKGQHYTGGWLEKAIAVNSVCSVAENLL